MIKQNAFETYQKSAITTQLTGSNGKYDVALMNLIIPKKSKNKNKLLKNLLIATTGLAVATFCTIAIAKVCKLSKIKKDIIKCYDEIR